MAAILKDANVFGLSWLGNGATIKQTPLLIMLLMCGNSPPTVMSIFYCTEHMSTGEKKDATFIMEQFKEKVADFDEMTQLIDCFFFDSASKVQTAGTILCATFPIAMCFHGGKHVLSLFFSNLSKLKPIQVSLSRFSLIMSNSIALLLFRHLC